MRGSDADQLFGVFNGISIIATTYASGIIPEIQVSLASWYSFFTETNSPSSSLHKKQSHFFGPI